MCFVVCERRCAGAVNVSGPVRRAPIADAAPRRESGSAWMGPESRVLVPRHQRTRDQRSHTQMRDGVTRWVFPCAFL